MTAVIESGADDSTSPDHAHLLLLPYGKAWLASTPRAVKLLTPLANRRGEAIIDLHTLFSITGHGWSIVLLGRRSFPSTETR